jgi:uncharacterized membrane protein YeaQ/YmgE (transglycosylase-associated protein family)
MGLFSWAIIGMFTGWLSNQIFRIPIYQIKVERLFSGVCGALTGGILSNVLLSTGGFHMLDFFWQSAVIAMVCALLILGIYFILNRWQLFLRN